MAKAGTLLQGTLQVYRCPLSSASLAKLTKGQQYPPPLVQALPCQAHEPI